jgi:carotenoid cleavage dioxygenase-like enzyme
MPSLGKIWYRWAPTVRCDMKSRWPIPLLVRPAAPDAAEDDGYVMVFVHNPDRGAADLVILAAQDFTSQPVARVHLPARIPLGFHGSWIADQ